MTTDANRRPRAVVTGLGVVAPNGIGTEAWWRATCTATSPTSARSFRTARPARQSGLFPWPGWGRSLSALRASGAVSARRRPVVKHTANLGVADP